MKTITGTLFLAILSFTSLNSFGKLYLCIDCKVFNAPSEFTRCSSMNYSIRPRPRRIVYSANDRNLRSPHNLVFVRQQAGNFRHGLVFISNNIDNKAKIRKYRAYINRHTARLAGPGWNPLESSRKEAGNPVYQAVAQYCAKHPERHVDQAIRDLFYINR